MTPLRVGVVCDLVEEGWHSMDLIADMLMDMLPKVGPGIVATRLCPPMIPRWSRLPLVGGTSRAKLGDRLTGRLWDYPRWLAPRVADFDVFHIVDQSYAHLVRGLPARQTIVTCHDLDAVDATLRPQGFFDPARFLAAPILDGLARAAHVSCVSEATRAELLATGRVDARHAGVIYEGVHPSCSPAPSRQWDGEIDERLGPRGVEILHVGSTIPRKRIDLLLEIFRGVRDTVPDAKLLRVGGPLTPEQRAQAVRLNLSDAIVELPFLERPALSALYRRASLVVLPSEREGFGLPVVEAMACGTPVVASAIPALQEIGGRAASYCPVGDVPRWVETVGALLQERQTDPSGWERRRQTCLTSAARFDWELYAAEMATLYSCVWQASRPAAAVRTAS